LPPQKCQFRLDVDSKEIVAIFESAFCTSRVSSNTTLLDRNFTLKPDWISLLWLIENWFFFSVRLDQSVLLNRNCCNSTSFNVFNSTDSIFCSTGKYFVRLVLGSSSTIVSVLTQQNCVSDSTKTEFNRHSRFSLIRQVCEAWQIP
jgi:hypothetical protein